MTEPRRVRTQVERDADGVAWRQTADTRPGFATYPQTPPGDPSWWRRTASPIPVTAGQVVRQSAWVGLPPPADGETCAKWCGYCHLNNEPAPTEPTERETWCICGCPDSGPCPQCLPAEAVARAVDSRSSEPPPVDRSWIEMTAQPRRRWWHRLTRRAL